MFVHEIISGKWVLCGTKIKQAEIAFYYHESCVNMYIALFQVLLCISPNQEDTLNTILNV